MELGSLEKNIISSPVAVSHIEIFPVPFWSSWETALGAIYDYPKKLTPRIQVKYINQHQDLSQDFKNACPKHSNIFACPKLATNLLIYQLLLVAYCAKKGNLLIYTSAMW